MLFTEPESVESLDHNILPQRTYCFLDQIADRLVTVLDKRLVQENNFGIVLFQFPIYDLIDNFGRFPIVFGLMTKDFSFFLDIVLNIFKEGNIRKAVCGEQVGTRIAACDS